MGCCPGAGGDTLSISEESGLKRDPTPDGKGIIGYLVTYFDFPNLETLFREKQTRLAGNDVSWDAEVRNQLDRFERSGIVPRELVNLYHQLGGTPTES